MTDTSPAMAARYRAMLMARSGEARLRMGDSMYATARALVIASVLDRNPSIPLIALRQAIFTRFYGHEFDEATRERILARIASAGEGEPLRVRRRVPVDWDQLDLAMTWHDAHLAHFLDVRTGEVRLCALSGFSGDAEGLDLTEEEADEGLADGYLVRIEPLESSVEYDWMVEFAASVASRRVRDHLQTALDGHRPFRRFKDALAQHQAERERWFRFHDERVGEAMRQWLEDNDIEPTTAPPVRPSDVR